MGSQFEDRLDTIENRLAKIEKQLKLPTAKSESKRSAETDPFADIGLKPMPAIESKPGNWLGIIAIICFVLAAGFIIKLSIESGWLTQERQVGLAALLGLGLIGAGLLISRTDREYASYLPGAGIIILFLTVFAAHRYYALISFESAIALTGLVSGICIALYGYIRHDVYPTAAAAGSYIAPAVLGFHAEAVFSLYYFLICSLGFTLISIWMRSRVLTLVAAYAAFVMTALIGIDLGQDNLVAGIMGLQFLIFLGGTFIYAYANDVSFKQNEAWSFFPVLLIFYAAEYFFIDRIHTGLAPWISLAFAAVLIGIYLIAKAVLPKGAKTSQPVVLAYAAIVAFHSFYLELLPHDMRPWLFTAILVGLAGISHKVSGVKKGDSFYIPVATVTVIAAIEYISMVYHLLEKYDSSWLAISFAALASLWFAVAAGNKVWVNKLSNVLLASAHVLAILALYRLTTDQGSLAVSASWLLYAVAVMLFAVARKDQVMAKSALAVLGFAAAKALLYDAASAPTVIRIFCLLLTGAVLYGCGFFMRKVTDWKGERA